MRVIIGVIATVAVVGAASAAARPHDRLGADEVAVLVALHRTLDADGSAGCLNPVVDTADLDDSARLDARDELRESGSQRPSRRAVEDAIKASERGSWGDLTTAPLDAALEAAVVDAYAAAAMRASSSTRPAMLRAGQLPSDIALRATCHARLGRPTIQGDWAFVGHVSVSAGHLYALRRTGGTWRAVAHRFTATA